LKRWWAIRLLLGTTRTLLWLFITIPLLVIGALFLGFPAFRHDTSEAQVTLIRHYRAKVVSPETPQAWDMIDGGHVSNRGRYFMIFDPDDRFAPEAIYRRLVWSAGLAKRYPGLPDTGEVKCARRVTAQFFRLIEGCHPDEMSPLQIAK
jgi:hypothetical protein